ncbi:hypothetical protein G9A89_010645 [Geosiphon pyriformis]|nr:hypothetical protein G9A89_010645 [Geosiphon pyriformis]
MDYMFTIFSLLGFLFALVPGLFHIQNRNWAAIYLTFWVCSTNLINFVNSIIWGDTIVDDKPNTEIWCRITTPLYVTSAYGLILSLTCMIRTLYTYVAKPLILTEALKRRQAIRETIICVLLPMIFSGLYLIIQNHKYSVRIILGCFSPSYPSIMRIFLHLMWPVIFSLIASFYAALTAFAIIQKRLEIQQLLSLNTSGINKAKFYRLVFFCMTLLLLMLPGTVYLLVVNTEPPFPQKPWSFTNSKAKWNKITAYPDELNLTDYFKPVTGILLFIFFGNGRDANAAYQRWGRKCKLDKVFPGCFSAETESDLEKFGFENKKNFSTSESSSLPSYKSKAMSSFGNSEVDNKNSRTLSTYRKDERFLTVDSSFDDSSYTSSNDTSHQLASQAPKKKKNKFVNFLFMHRTPTEQSNFDLTSGLKIRIEGLGMNTVMESQNEPGPCEVLEEKEAPKYEPYDNVGQERRRDMENVVTEIYNEEEKEFENIQLRDNHMRTSMDASSSENVPQVKLVPPTLPSNTIAFVETAEV